MSKETLEEKWAPLLDYTSSNCPAVPDEYRAYVARLLEYTEMKTKDVLITNEDMDRIIAEEKKLNNGYSSTEAHNGYDNYVGVWTKVRMEVPWVRRNWDKINMKRLRVRYVNL